MPGSWRRRRYLSPLAREPPCFNCAKSRRSLHAASISPAYARAVAAFAFYLLAFIVLVVMPAAVVVGLAKLFSRPASPSARRWRIGLAALAYCVWLIVPLTVWAMGWTGARGHGRAM